MGCTSNAEKQMFIPGKGTGVVEVIVDVRGCRKRSRLKTIDEFVLPDGILVAVLRV